MKTFRLKRGRLAVLLLVLTVGGPVIVCLGLSALENAPFDTADLRRDPALAPIANGLREGAKGHHNLDLGRIDMRAELGLPWEEYLAAISPALAKSGWVRDSVSESSAIFSGPHGTLTIYQESPGVRIQIE